MLMWAMLLTLAILLVAVSVYAINNRSRFERFQSEMSTKLSQLNGEIIAVNNGAIGVGQQLINAEKKLNTVISDQERLQSTSEYQPYGQAELLAGRGAGAEQLTEQFGLSESEAQLMSMLQKRASEHRVQ